MERATRIHLRTIARELRDGSLAPGNAAAMLDLICNHDVEEFDRKMRALRLGEGAAPADPGAGLFTDRAIPPGDR